MDLELTLKKYFGYDNFHPGQKNIISSVLNSEDTLAILPTGGGKSICYQIPGLVFPEKTIVISPLISLMQDQVETLNRKNIPAIFLNSSLPKKELTEKLNNLQKYKFIYLAPERLNSKKFLNAVKKIKIDLLAVDEAHCIAQWGHDFRPSYLQINDFLQKIQGELRSKRGCPGVKSRPVVMALTATATPQVRDEIIKYLNLKKPNIFIKSFARKNLALNIFHYRSTTAKEIDFCKILKKHEGKSGIVYALTRAKTEQLAKLINHFLGSEICVAYHAGLEQNLRAQIQTDFIAGKIRIITATNAFGMGVDKSDVRFVIHFQMPGGLENYYQEVGRAGRDNKDADCYLLTAKSDLTINHQFIAKGNLEQQKNLSQKLNLMLKFAHQKKCKSQLVLNYFGEKTKTDCKRCSICTKNKIVFNPQQLKIILRLIEFRRKIAKKNKLHFNKIMTDQVIAWISLFSPQNKNDLLKIPGIGRGWVKQWGDDIIERCSKPKTTL
jgi:ATP-dependent DNA helicase RecQ